MEGPIGELKRPKYAQFYKEDSGQNIHACSACNLSISKHICPPFSEKNNVMWPPKIPELDITPDEERLIALRLPFMQIRILPSGGQQSLRGNVINVPTDINPTVSMLPRYVNEQGTFNVRLKGRLQYRAVYRNSPSISTKGI